MAELKKKSKVALPPVGKNKGSTMCKKRKASNSSSDEDNSFNSLQYSSEGDETVKKKYKKRKLPVEKKSKNTVKCKKRGMQTIFSDENESDSYSEEDENSNKKVKKLQMSEPKKNTKRKNLTNDGDEITDKKFKTDDFEALEGTNWVIQVLSQNCGIGLREAKNIIEMFEDDCTVPFIVRYRGDRTGNMDADKIRQIKQYYTNLMSLQKKKQLALNKLEKIQDVPSYVRRSVLNIKTLDELEHVCATYKTAGRKTKAGKAKELGLETIATDIMEGITSNGDLTQFINPQKEGLRTVNDVIEGVKNIIADIISKNREVLDHVQELMEITYITISSTKNVKNTNKKDDKKPPNRNRKQEGNEKYEHYYGFKCRVNDIKPHQMLALNRGEREEKLKISFDVPKWLHDKLFEFCRQKWLYRGFRNNFRETLFIDSFNDSYSRLILPYILRRIRSHLNEEAQKAGIETFASNLKALLLTNPIRGHPILGIDPGFTHGNKMALVSASGNVLWTHVFPSSQNVDHVEFCTVKTALITHKCELIALGNGCGSRQMEDRLSRYIKNAFFQPELNVRYTIVNERGSSVYSCSTLAKEEFPDLIPNLISAVFIARSIQDPLNEYIKVNPENLSVGMYQRDMPTKKLGATLDEVVTECVSFVGVDINVASFHLLKSVSGLNKNTAAKLIEWRNKYGSYSNRDQIKLVKGIGTKTFQQCSGFLRIIPETAENPGDEDRRRSLLKKSKRGLDSDFQLLDRTWIHPELYPAAYKFLNICSVQIDDFGNARFSNQINNTVTTKGLSAIADELNIPMEHATLIKDALTKPMDYDYRSQFSEPLFRSGCMTLTDLRIGMDISGYVTNMTHFGAFIDIGVTIEGLIHVSKMKSTILKVGDRVNVEVLNVDASKNRIQLALLSVIENNE